MKVLFVCKSNVGRSQMAQSIFNSLTNSRNAMSAGVLVEEKYLGGRIGEIGKTVTEAMKEIGIDASNNISKQLTPEMAKSADKIIMMVPRDIWPDYIKSSDKVEFWDVVDPRHTGIEGHRKCRDELKEKIIDLLKRI